MMVSTLNIYLPSCCILAIGGPSFYVLEKSKEECKRRQNGALFDSPNMAFGWMTSLR